MANAVAVGRGERQVGRDAHLDLAAGLHGDRPERVDGALDEVGHVLWLDLEVDATGLDARDVEHVVDELDEAVGVLLDDREELLLDVVDLAGIAVQDEVDVALDRRQRRAQLVADRRDELVLHLRDLVL